MLKSCYQSNTKSIPGYTIFKQPQLGSGNFGVVYKGQSINSKNNQIVAIKQIYKKKVSNPYLKNALQRQKTIMSKLKTPHTVQLIEVIQDQNFVYIVLELCDKSLHDKIVNDVVPDQQRQLYAINLLTQLVNGLSSLVRNNIIHRDLKPQNILIKNQILKICDYGFAKVLINCYQQIQQSYVGTPYYQPIQVLFGQTYTTKFDVWSLGVIFYQLLFGAKPWPSDNMKTLKHNIKTKPLNLQRNFNEVTKDFVRRCLALEQKNRLSWQDLFNHKIFQGFFDHKNDTPYNMKLIRFIEKAKQNIKQNKLNIDLIIKNKLKESKQGQLNFEQFYQFLKILNPQISLQLALYIFNKTDTDVSDRLSQSEIVQFLQKYGLTKDLIYDEKLIQKIRKIALKIKRLSERNELMKVEKLFQTFNKEKNGRMSLDQFERFIIKIEKQMKTNEILQAFQFIDIDNSGTIELNQLLQVLNKYG